MVVEKLYKCSKCKLKKPLSDFNLRTGKRAGKPHSYCKQCKVKYDFDKRKNLSPENKPNKKYKRKVRDYIFEYKLNNPCTDCEKFYHPHMMQFDHLEDKIMNVSAMYTKYGLPKVKQEMSKCELVCANCHALRTSSRLIQNPAKIISLEDFLKIKRHKSLKIVLTSGGYAPLHIGHLECIRQSKQYGDILVVIVNGDKFLERKHGKAFIPIDVRCRIMSEIQNIDYVIPYDTDNDNTVIKPLELIKPYVFTKGGDRTDSSNIPEWNICQQLGIKVITGVGGDKIASSSDYLKEWVDFKNG